MSKILLTGGTGKLGTAILNSGLFENIIAPKRSQLDITNQESINQFFGKNDISFIIHCAAQARMIKCENNPCDAISSNIIGTANLVCSVLQYKPSIRFLQISTDYVYEGKVGMYKETDLPAPINVYGLSKLGSEISVRMLNNYCVIRTSFFDSENIPFDDAPIDQYSSKMPLNDLVKAIHKILLSDFKGIINVGSKKSSNFEHLKKYKTLKKIKFEDMQKSAKIPMAIDSSLDTSLYSKLFGDVHG